MNNTQFRILLGSPKLNMNNNNQNNSDNFVIEHSPLRKKRRVTNKYFKDWIILMNNIYNNIYENDDQSLNIYENRNKTCK